MASPTAHAPAPPEATETQIHCALFAGMLDRLEVARKHHILDAGAAQPDNIAFFGQLRCKLYVKDLYGALTDPGTNRAGALVEALRGGPAPLAPATIDVVLCWDLLDYLGASRLPDVSAEFATAMRPGAFLHAFIATHDAIPAEPCSFHMRDATTVQARTHGREMRAAPRYSQPELRRLMPEFVVERTILLRSGLQEYLFRRR